MIVRRAFRFRLKPTSNQQLIFLRFAGARRWIFNYGLEQRTKAYKEEKKNFSYFEQNIELTKLKKQPETAWLKDIHSQILQQALKDLQLAFQNFFRRLKTGGEPGFPKFKKRGIKDGFRYPQGVKLNNDCVFLPKIGWVKFNKSREILGTIKEATISQEGDEWHISLSCQWEKNVNKAPIEEKRAVGIDLGLTNFATLAIGEQNICKEEPNPRFLRTLLPRLRLLSKRLSKKVKGSRNRDKARLKLSKLHSRIKNCRQDFIQRLTTEMIKNHDIFCVEDLAISHLLQDNTRKLSRSISDAGWRYFLHCLKYKAEEMGKHFVQLNRYFASTQICSSCDGRQKMELSVREYHCLSCGLKIGRDYNSAIDLKTAGMSVLNACGATTR